MKFSHTYTNIKDLPKHKKGWEFRWSGGRNRFFPAKVRQFDWEDKSKPDYTEDFDAESYSLEEIQNTDWFQPVGELTDFVPVFPSKTKLKDYLHMFPETKLINDVDICRCLNEMFDSKDFENVLYNFYKKEYNKYFKLK